VSRLVETDTPPGNPVGRPLKHLPGIYARLPEGACALDEVDGRAKLNLGCARLHEHMCVGWADLVQVYDRALQSRKALAVRNEAIQGAGCPADLFAANATLPML